MLILSLSLYDNILLEPCFVTGHICDKCIVKDEEPSHISKRYLYCSLLHKSAVDCPVHYLAIKTVPSL